MGTDLEQMINDLIALAGDEWKFMMGSEFAEQHPRIPDSPRRVYWASMSTHVLYAGGFSRRFVPLSESHLQILSAEKHWSFIDAVADLAAQMRAYLPPSTNKSSETNLLDFPGERDDNDPTTWQEL